jgi:cell division topological specificity factor
MNLFRSPRPISSAPVARKRLQTLLEYERGLLDPDLFTVLREEILSCVSRYVTVDPDKVQLKVDRGARVSALALELKFPT